MQLGTHFRNTGGGSPSKYQPQKQKLPRPRPVSVRSASVFFSFYRAVRVRSVTQTERGPDAGRTITLRKPGPLTCAAGPANATQSALDLHEPRACLHIGTVTVLPHAPRS
eukprot:gene14085-biopygen5083